MATHNPPGQARLETRGHDWLVSECQENRSRRLSNRPKDGGTRLKEDGEKARSSELVQETTANLPFITATQNGRSEALDLKLTRAPSSRRLTRIWSRVAATRSNRRSRTPASRSARSINVVIGRWLPRAGRRCRSSCRSCPGASPTRALNPDEVVAIRRGGSGRPLLKGRT